ncbi:MAG: (deoxy)nucleoside triphosphate pyrophosphohydrolase [Bryobacteraceae bacterium]
MLTVVAAVIERDGKILICQRRKGASHELKWEFPGGKVEPHEHPRAALRRELEEELDIDASIGEEITRYEHTYPGKPPLQLIFLRVDRFRGEPRNKIFEDIRWERAARFPDYDFLDGDLDFVRRMAREAGS